MKSYETRIDLQANAKAASIDLLNSRLAYAIDLALVTKQAQWILKGFNLLACVRCLAHSAANSIPMSIQSRNGWCNSAEPRSGQAKQ